MNDQDERRQDFSPKKGVWMATAVVATIVFFLVWFFVFAVTGSSFFGLVVAVIAGLLWAKVQHRHDPMHWNYGQGKRKISNDQNKPSNRFGLDPPPKREFSSQTDETTTSATQDTGGKDNKPVKWATIGAVIGLIVGSYTGIAALGTAVNGAVVFAVIGGIIGYLLARQSPRS